MAGAWITLVESTISGPVRRWALSWAPLLWSLALALLLLGPTLAPGFVLSYDMVWVPDLPVRPDGWGLGSGLPRAVPSDAVVAVLDEVVPGSLLQKLTLLGALVAGGTGAARLVPGEAVAPRLVAISAYQWTPLVAERLLLGAWPVLVALGVLPWLVVLGSRWRTSGRMPAALLLLVPLGCLSASAGLATAVVLLASAAGSSRVTVRALVLVVAGNAPWVVTGALHAADAMTDRSGAAVFALQGHGALPTPIEALALGGTWNSEVVLPSRSGLLAWVGIVLLLSLLLVVRGWWSAVGGRNALALVIPWAVGLGLALSTWVAPGVTAALGETVPGAGLLRDGARSLVLCAPLVAALAGYAAARVAARVADEAPRLVLLGALAVVPVMLLPDAALGLAGRLHAVAYPASYDAVRRSVEALDGDVLVLPLSSYRQPSWNCDRKVLDPLPRWLSASVVASDRLVVGSTVVPGEDPRVRAAEVALLLDSPNARAAALSSIGVGAVVAESGTGETPEVAGRVVLEDGPFSVVALPDPAPREVPWTWVAAAGAAWLAYGGLLLIGSVLVLLRGARAVRRQVPG